MLVEGVVLSSSFSPFSTSSSSEVSFTVVDVTEEAMVTLSVRSAAPKSRSGVRRRRSLSCCSLRHSTDEGVLRAVVLAVVEHSPPRTPLSLTLLTFSGLLFEDDKRFEFLFPVKAGDCLLMEVGLSYASVKSAKSW